MNIEELINEHYQDLSKNDIYIWNYIQKNREKCKNIGINELAKKCNVSRTTILRFAKKLSLNGYSELKVYLNWDNKVKETRYMDENLVDKVCETCKYSIDEIKKRDFTDICSMIYSAKRIFVYGTGELQRAVAGEMKRMFSYSGDFMHILSGEKETEMILPHLNNEDLVILISLTGESVIINDFAKKLLVRNISTISMSRLENNSLVRSTTKSIYILTSTVMISENLIHEAANLFFILVEILFIKYSQYKQKKLVLMEKIF